MKYQPGGRERFEAKINDEARRRGDDRATMCRKAEMWAETMEDAQARLLIDVRASNMHRLVGAGWGYEQREALVPILEDVWRWGRLLREWLDAGAEPCPVEDVEVPTAGALFGAPKLVQRHETKVTHDGFVRRSWWEAQRVPSVEPRYSLEVDAQGPAPDETERIIENYGRVVTISRVELQNAVANLIAQDAAPAETLDTRCGPLEPVEACATEAETLPEGWEFIGGSGRHRIARRDVDETRAYAASGGGWSLWQGPRGGARKVATGHAADFASACRSADKALVDLLDAAPAPGALPDGWERDALQDRYVTRSAGEWFAVAWLDGAWRILPSAAGRTETIAFGTAPDLASACQAADAKLAELRGEAEAAPDPELEAFKWDIRALGETTKAVNSDGQKVTALVGLDVTNDYGWVAWRYAGPTIAGGSESGEAGKAAAEAWLRRNGYLPAEAEAPFEWEDHGFAACAKAVNAAGAVCSAWAYQGDSLGWVVWPKGAGKVLASGGGERDRAKANAERWLRSHGFKPAVAS